MGWFSRLLGREHDSGPPSAGKPSRQETGHTVAPMAIASEASRAPTEAAPMFLPWLPATQVLTDTALSASEQALLGKLDALLHLPSLPDALLPRAARRAAHSAVSGAHA